MPRRLQKADAATVAAALDRTLEPDAGEPADADLRLLVRHFLAVLSERAPGRSVEVRVPPHGAAQAVPGPRHTRGTPSATVEADAWTWVLVASGHLGWAEAVASGRVLASGERSDLSQYLPLI